MPDKKIYKAYQAALLTISRVKGKVFAPDYGYLCEMAGKNGSAHMGIINDVLRGSDTKVRRQVIETIRQAIKDRTFGAIILDRRMPLFQIDMEKHYQLMEDFKGRTACWLSPPRTTTRP